MPYARWAAKQPLTYVLPLEHRSLTTHVRYGYAAQTHRVRGHSSYWRARQTRVLKAAAWAAGCSRSLQQTSMTYAEVWCWLSARL